MDSASEWSFDSADSDATLHEADRGDIERVLTKRKREQPHLRMTRARLSSETYRNKEFLDKFHDILPEHLRTNKHAETIIKGSSEHNTERAEDFANAVIAACWWIKGFIMCPREGDTDRVFHCAYLESAVSNAIEETLDTTGQSTDFTVFGGKIKQMARALMNKDNFDVYVNFIEQKQ